MHSSTLLFNQGNIQRNQYGNIDLFVDTMLPPGAVHLKCSSFRSSFCNPLFKLLICSSPLLCRQRHCQGREEVGNQLRRRMREFYYYYHYYYCCDCLLHWTKLDRSTSPCLPLSQQTGFEFKQKKAIPQLEGVVVAVENAEVLLEVRDLPTPRPRVRLALTLLVLPFQGLPGDGRH